MSGSNTTSGTAWEAVIGLEVHVQLRTATKLFCRCPNRFGAEPNTLVCPVCLGYPGTLPVLNRAAVEQAVRLCLALGARVRRRSVFARKSYFYPDLPKGYQVSQLDLPLGEGGRLPLSRHERTVALRRLHLEEDAGKLLHEMPGGGELSGASLVDFNRCGVPLVELVSEPELRSPAEAQDYLQTLHQVLRYTDTSDANMDEGSLRCDANVSIRRRGDERLGTRTEIKNLNSFRHVARALEHEIERQVRVVASGGEVVQETLSWDAGAGVTRSLRGKEEAQDYRYFPEPDLPPVRVPSERLERASAALPELPWHRRERFVADYGLSADDADTLTAARELADYFEAAAAACGETARPAVANWVKTEILRELKQRRAEVDAAPAPERLARFVELVAAGTVSSSAGKTVLEAMWEQHDEPAELARRLGLVQVQDTDRLETWAREALEGHDAQVEQYRQGKEGLLGFFVGQAMRRSGGRADPRAVRELLRRLLAGEEARTG